MIWDPIHVSPTLISSIVYTQHRLLKLVSESWSSDYSSLLSQFCLHTLERRRKITKATLIFKLKLNLSHSHNSPFIPLPPPPPQYFRRHYDSHNYLSMVCKFNHSQSHFTQLLSSSIPSSINPLITNDTIWLHPTLTQLPGEFPI